jgi:hypothetical protein
MKNCLLVVLATTVLHHEAESVVLVANAKTKTFAATELSVQRASVIGGNASDWVDTRPWGAEKIFGDRHPVLAKKSASKTSCKLAADAKLVQKEFDLVAHDKVPVGIGIYYCKLSGLEPNVKWLIHLHDPSEVRNRNNCPSWSVEVAYRYDYPCKVCEYMLGMYAGREAFECYISEDKSEVYVEPRVFADDLPSAAHAGSTPMISAVVSMLLILHHLQQR